MRPRLASRFVLALFLILTSAMAAPVGLYDTTSPPGGVWAAINQMKGPVEPLPARHRQRGQLHAQPLDQP